MAGTWGLLQRSDLIDTAQSREVRMPVRTQAREAGRVASLLGKY